jgi:kynureninase
VSFYRPTAARHRILMEETAFPSDTYAVRSQILFHGHDPEQSLLIVPHGESILSYLERHGDAVALVLLGGVNYYTGEAFDLASVADQARRKGCLVGYDLAHAAGNLELRLHDWGVDFAAWCSYKYLNGGPGGVAGCFVHERHAERPDLPRFAGWWGKDPKTRFRMHLEPDFVPAAGADGWQLSNPPVLALALLASSLELFDEAGMGTLRAKSERLSAYMLALVDHVDDPRVEVLTPRDPVARGCQLSLKVSDDAHRLFDRLKAEGVVVDYREPDVIRAAPVPLYNSFHDVWRFGDVLSGWSKDRG